MWDFLSITRDVVKYLFMWFKYSVHDRCDNQSFISLLINIFRFRFQMASRNAKRSMESSTIVNRGIITTRSQLNRNSWKSVLLHRFSLSRVDVIVETIKTRTQLTIKR